MDASEPRNGFDFCKFATVYNRHTFVKTMYIALGPKRQHSHLRYSRSYEVDLTSFDASCVETHNHTRPSLYCS